MEAVFCINSTFLNSKKCLNTQQCVELQFGPHDQYLLLNSGTKLSVMIDHLLSVYDKKVHVRNVWKCSMAGEPFFCYTGWPSWIVELAPRGDRTVVSTIPTVDVGVTATS